MKKLNYLCGVALLVLCQNGMATVFTVGALSSNDDGSTEVIKDSLNNLEWLRLDVLDKHTYTETLDDIGSGAHFGQGWNVSHAADAQRFMNAMFDPINPSCTTTAQTHSFQLCGAAGPTQLTGLLGYNDKPNFVAWFLSDNNFSTDVGYIFTFENNGQLWTQNEFGTIGDTINPTRNPLETNNVSWLLYRNAPSVPEPTTLALLGLGLFGLGFNRRKRI